MFKLLSYTTSLYYYLAATQKEACQASFFIG